MVNDEIAWKRAGRLFTARMNQRGLSVEAVAKRSGMSRFVVGEVRAGKPRARGPRTLVRLSVAVGWRADSLEKILGGGDPEESGTIELAPDPTLADRIEAGARDAWMGPTTEERLQRVEGEIKRLAAIVAAALDHREEAGG